MREMKWTYGDLINTPIPSFFQISRGLHQLAKKERAEAKKK